MENGKILRLGLVGKDVSKSFSEVIHKFILRELGYGCEYQRFSVPKERFDDTMRTLMGDFDGFNVTIPYKRDVMCYLSDLTGDALDYGAVNTVVTATGKGYNTDGKGFLLMLTAADFAVKDKQILVLGAGGSGRSTAVALKQAGASVSIYQRNREKLEKVCQELGLTPACNPEAGGYDMLINCTGVGMHDTEGQSPVSAKAFSGAKTAVDLIYTPVQSEFLRLAAAQGLRTLNGEAMLFYQAYYADCLYLDIPPSEAQAKALYYQYLNQ